MINKNNYPWHKQNTLVIYAINDEDENPHEQTPKLIVDNDNLISEYLFIDQAPRLVTLVIDYFIEDEILPWLDNNNNPVEIEILDNIIEWCQDQVLNGYSYVAYELEPKEIAGNAHSIALASEKSANYNKYLDL
jgi:hypothetical protein